MKPIERCITTLRSVNYLIALTGAGISQESNVPTFRGKNGLWRQYNAMELATPSAFNKHPHLVWEWYSWRQDLIARCRPNPAHWTLAKWEARGLLKTLITQNVDGLHQRAGSKNILPLHGTIWAVKCTRCSFYSQISTSIRGIPQCPDCKTPLRPAVVWFGENLSSNILNQVFKELELADAMIVIGTSALVQPSASFPFIVKRHNGQVIEVNIEATPLTPLADVHLRGKAGVILPQIDKQLQNVSTDNTHQD